LLVRQRAQQTMILAQSQGMLPKSAS